MLKNVDWGLYVQTYRYNYNVFLNNEKKYMKIYKIWLWNETYVQIFGGKSHFKFPSTVQLHKRKNWFHDIQLPKYSNLIFKKCRKEFMNTANIFANIYVFSKFV